MTSIFYKMYYGFHDKNYEGSTFADFASKPISSTEM